MHELLTTKKLSKSTSHHIRLLMSSQAKFGYRAHLKQQQLVQKAVQMVKKKI